MAPSDLQLLVALHKSRARVPLNGSPLPNYDTDQGTVQWHGRRRTSMQLIQSGQPVRPTLTGLLLLLAMILLGPASATGRATAYLHACVELEAANAGAGGFVATVCEC